MIRFSVLILMMVMAYPLLAGAQDAENADSFLAGRSSDEKTAEGGASSSSGKPPEAAAEPQVETDPAIVAKKVDLAKKMHQIRPTRMQVDSALERAAQSMVEAERAPFLLAMKSALNYNAIEKISVDAMVETFTLPELEAMIEYHSKPEAQSVGQEGSAGNRAHD
jgi:hypothetical protein